MNLKLNTVAAFAVVVLASSTPLLAEVTSDGDGERTDEVQMMGSAKLSAQEAGAAAMQAVPGKIYDIGFDVAKSGPVWNVTIVDQGGTEMRVAVDAATGNILSKGAEGEQDDDTN